MIPIAVAAVVLATAGAASAHVGVDPQTAAQGSYTRLTFHVPNERDDSSTVQVEIALPVDAPLASVAVKPVPGWTSTVQKTDLATPLTTDDGQVTQVTSRVTWKGGEIRPGEYQDFSLSVGPLPTTRSSLVFKALQTYADGEVVRWIDEAVPGAKEPDHPAPVVTLLPRAAASSDASAADASTVTSTHPVEVAPHKADTTARTLGGIAVALAVVALGVAVATALRRRSSR